MKKARTSSPAGAIPLGRSEKDLTTKSLNHRPAATDEINEQDHQRYHEQQVDKTTKRVTRNHAYQPQDQENHEDCPKHYLFLLLCPA
jgi:hypothetical protein